MQASGDKTDPQPSVVAFLGSSSNVNLLFEPQEEGDSFHYALPDDMSSNPRMTELDNEDLEVLKFRGAFLLPPRDLCDDLIESFFEKIHPTMPILNRSQFMRSYNNPSNPPSLLLLQSMLLAGSRVCKSPALLDSDQSVDLASLTFYKRAKALFDANYETDRITIVQSVMLLGWWWEGPEDVTRNSFYWSRVALSIAQGFGLHRSMENTSMPLATKRTWKKVWWALFARDRWGAVGLGRPVMINLEDSDVPMLTEDDFIEDEPGFPSLYPMNRIQVLAFIHTVKLSEIMGMVLRQQFSVNAENSRRQNKVPVVSHCDMAMGSWMSNLPPELKYSVKDKANHNFFIATLHAQYYTVLCLVHRSNVLRKGNLASDNPYPSWGIAFQAAHMISRIMENLLQFEECGDCSVFYIYTVFSAMIMLLYQTDSPTPSVVESAKKAFETCSVALNEMGKKWMVARMIQKLFKPLNADKQLREQYVKDAQKRANTSPNARYSKKVKVKSKVSSSSREPIPNRRTFPESSYSPSAIIDQGAMSKPAMSPPSSSVRTMFSKQPVLSLDQVQGNIPNFTSSSSPAMVEGLSSQMQVGGPGGWNKQMHRSHLPDHTNAAPPLVNPDFLFVTNNPPDSQNFYQNFQPSQLFPDPNDSEGRGSLSEMLFSNTNAVGMESAESSTSSISGQTPPQPHPTHTSGSGMMHSTPSDTISPAGEPPSHLSPTASRHVGDGNPEDMHGGPGSGGPKWNPGSQVPNSLNLNEWYHYLTSTFQSVHPMDHEGHNGRVPGHTPAQSEGMEMPTTHSDGDHGIMSDLLNLNHGSLVDNGGSGSGKGSNSGVNPNNS